MPRYLKLLLWLLGGAVLLCVVAVIIISVASANWARPWASRQLSEVAARSVQIDGDMRIDWERHDVYGGWLPSPVLYAHDITVANADWASTGPTMARVQAARLQLDVFALNQNVVRLTDLGLHGGQVVLERRADGANNWTFGDQSADPGSAKGWQLVVERLMLSDASLRVLDKARALDVVLTVDTSQSGSDRGPPPTGDSGTMPAANSGNSDDSINAGDSDDPGDPGDPGDPRAARPAADYGTRWSVQGHYHGVEVRGEGWLGHVLALQRNSDPFPVQGVLQVGATTLEAEGTITRPRDLAAVDVVLKLSGPTMAELYPILGLALPHTPPYETAGHLTGDLDLEQSTWIYNDFTGHVGESDLSGSLKYERREPRAMLSARLYSELLRFEDLGPLVGAPVPDGGREKDADPDTGQDAEEGSEKYVDPGAEQDVHEVSEKGSEDSSEKDDTPPAALPGQLTASTEQPDDKALPVKDADSRLWKVMDADVTFEGQRIESNADLPLDDVRAHVFLKDGVLRFEPLDFGVAGGSFESRITLDGNQEPILAGLDARARGLQLGKLFPGVESMDAALGAVHGDATLAGRGNSVSSLLANASGDVSAVVSRGTVSRFLLEAAGLNVANMVFVKLFGDEQVTVQCLAAEFHIENGLMDARTFVLETDDAVVTVAGTVNLTTEEMDLDIHPENKSLRIFTLRSPLYVAGTFKNPDIGVQKGPVATRAGAAVALGLVATPLAALLPLLNVGTDDETTCAAVSRAGPRDDGGIEDDDPDDGTLKGSVSGVAQP